MSVSTPACQPVSEMTGYPSFWMAMAKSDMEIISPVDRSTSISRLDGRALISAALAIRSSVVSPWAETTTTTWLPALYALVAMSATLKIRSVFATEVPPNF